MKQTFCFEPGVYSRIGKDSRINEEVAPTLRAAMGDNALSVFSAMGGVLENNEKRIKIRIDNPTPDVL